MHLLIAFLFFFSVSASAHHAAEGIIDEDIYAMIDSLVADTPHADMTFDTTTGDMVIDTTAVYLEATPDFTSTLSSLTMLLDSADTMAITYNPDGTATIVIE